MNRDDLKSVKSIEPGCGLKGPEYPGCYNTGMAAAIRHVHYYGPKESRPAPLKSLYMVGREIDLDMDFVDRNDKREIIAATHAKKPQVVLSNGRTIFLRYSFEEGMAKFDAMVAADTKIHDEARAEINKAREDLKSNDPETMMNAALTLGDYGAI